MSPQLHHVALLTRSAKGAGEFCRKSGFELGAVEDFPSEETREIYVGPAGGHGLLLLMEAIGPGPYQSALKKRGPGLHHVAINVPKIEAYIDGLAGSGWLLHPISIHTLERRRTVYLSRPGVRALIEVQEASATGNSSDDKRLISAVFIEGESDHQRLLDALRVPGLHVADKNGASLLIAGKRVAIADLAF